MTFEDPLLLAITSGAFIFMCTTLGAAVVFVLLKESYLYPIKHGV